MNYAAEATSGDWIAMFGTALGIIFGASMVLVLQWLGRR